MFTHLLSFPLPFISPQSKFEEGEGSLAPQVAHGFLGEPEDSTGVSAFNFLLRS